tara:strand:- start:512 stop:1423 length:912 start_codon:yes stop_codon:yes gene_type:complete
MKGKKILKTIGKSLISPVGIGLWAADAEFNNPVSDGTMTGHHKRKREDLIKKLPKDMRKKLKTYNQFNESVGKALAKFGSIGLRKAAKAVTSSSFKSKIPSSIRQLTSKQRRLKMYDLINKTGTSKANIETGKNYIAKSKISDKSDAFVGTVKPLPKNTRMRTDGAAGEIQLQGGLKGGEYKRKLSGKGDKDIFGTIGGSRGSGNKALRRSGQSDKVTDYDKKGWKPTPMFRKTKAELSTVSKDPSTGKLEPHKWNPGDNYMLSVDIKQSKKHSRGVREFLKQNQRRIANIKKGKGPVGMTEK